MLIYYIFFSSGVKPYNFKMNCDSGRPFLFHLVVTIKNIHLWFQYYTLIFPILRKHPSLLAPRREGRFARREETSIAVTARRDDCFLRLNFSSSVARGQWHLDGLPNQAARENTTDINTPEYFTNTMYHP